MGIEGLMTTKWLLHGDGHTVKDFASGGYLHQQLELNPQYGNETEVELNIGDGNETQNGNGTNGTQNDLEHSHLAH